MKGRDEKSPASIAADLQILGGSIFMQIVVELFFMNFIGALLVSMLVKN